MMNVAFIQRLFMRRLNYRTWWGFYNLDSNSKFMKFWKVMYIARSHYAVFSVKIPLENLSKAEVEMNLKAVDFQVDYPSLVFTKFMYVMQCEQSKLYQQYFELSVIFGHHIEAYFDTWAKAWKEHKCKCMLVSLWLSLIIVIKVTITMFLRKEKQ